MKKIKDLLSGDKEKRNTTICSLVLIMVFLFSIIFIFEPVLSNMNKYYSTEEKMFERLENEIWEIDWGREYYIFKDGKVYSFGSVVSVINSSLTDSFLKTKDLDAIKNIASDECYDMIFEYVTKEPSQPGDYYYLEQDVEIRPKDGKIIIDPHTPNEKVIDLKKSWIELSVDSEQYNGSAVTESEFEKMFLEAKEIKIDKDDFLPDRKAFRESVNENNKTVSLVNNTTDAMRMVNNADTSVLLVLGKNNTKVKACVMDGTNENYKNHIFKIGLMNDETISLDNLLTILDVYLKDYPTYPGESAHKEIKNKILNGVKKSTTQATIIHSEFELYNISFKVDYQPCSYSNNNIDYDFYLIWVTPMDIEISQQ